MAEITEIKAYFETQLKAEFEKLCADPSTPFAQDWQKGIDLFFELIKFPMEGINRYHDLLNALEDVLINKPTDYNALGFLFTLTTKYFFCRIRISDWLFF